MRIFSQEWLLKLKTLLGLNTWETYVPIVGATITAPQKATNPDQDIASYIIIGKTITINYNYVSFNNQAGATQGSGDYFWSMPSGVKIDTTKAPAETLGLNQGSSVGTARSGNGAGPAIGYVQIRDEDSFFLVVGRDGISIGRCGPVFFRMDDTAISYGFSVTLPIK